MFDRKYTKCLYINRLYQPSTHHYLMAKIKRGNKIAPSHSTSTTTAAQVVELLNKIPTVTKISLGIIVRTKRVTPRRIKFLPITGGMEISVVGNGAVQKLYVYTNDLEMVKTNLAQEFPGQ